LALSGCENLIHDLHKKERGKSDKPSGGTGGGGDGGGGGGGGGGGSGNGYIAIELSSPPFPEVEYNYTDDFYYIEVAVKIQSETLDTGPLDIELEWDGGVAGLFSASRYAIGNIAPGGQEIFTVRPQNGLPPNEGGYEVLIRASGDEAGSDEEADTFRVFFNAYLNLTAGRWEDRHGNALPPSPLLAGPNPFVIPADMAVRVTGSTMANANCIEVEADPSPGTVRTYVQLKDAVIELYGVEPLLLKNGAKVTLDLSGDNRLISTYGLYAGLAAPDGTVLIIEGTGTLLAIGGNYGAGIGGTYSPLNKGGDITIRGGTVTATSNYGSGIGGGAWGDGGNITIKEGSIVTAISGLGAGIGGGQGHPTPGRGGSGGTITISGGTVTAFSREGAGIGAGTSEGSSGNYANYDGGTIRIEGGVICALSFEGGAGIGGGYLGRAGNITITGGTVIAGGMILGLNPSTSYSGAGIGNGRYGATTGNRSVTISGGTVYAFSRHGSGIGKGYDDTNDITLDFSGAPVIIASSIDSGGQNSPGIVTASMESTYEYSAIPPLSSPLVQPLPPNFWPVPDQGSMPAGTRLFFAMTGVTCTLPGDFTVPPGATVPPMVTLR
jgi:hypothetical protein